MRSIFYINRSEKCSRFRKDILIALSEDKTQVVICVLLIAQAGAKLSPGKIFNSARQQVIL